MNHISGESLKG